MFEIVQNGIKIYFSIFFFKSCIIENLVFVFTTYCMYISGLLFYMH